MVHAGLAVEQNLRQSRFPSMDLLFRLRTLGIVNYWGTKNADEEHVTPGRSGAEAGAGGS